MYKKPINIYYSRSSNIIDSLIMNKIQKLRDEIKETTILNCYTQGTAYSNKDSREAHLIIVGLKSTESTEKVGKGCHMEIEYAIENNIPIVAIWEDVKGIWKLEPPINIDEGDFTNYASYGTSGQITTPIREFLKLDSYIGLFPVY